MNSINSEQPAAPHHSVDRWTEQATVHIPFPTVQTLALRLPWRSEVESVTNGLDNLFRCHQPHRGLVAGIRGRIVIPDKENTHRATRRQTGQRGAYQRRSLSAQTVDFHAYR
jgi:hypothetical protein